MAPVPVLKNAEQARCVRAPEWARDGKSIFCHDLDNIYYIDLDGNVLKKWELSKILTDVSMNGGDRLSVSPDGNAVLWMSIAAPSTSEKTGMVPSPRLKNSKFTRRKAVRVTGKDDFVWQPFWLSANEFLCIIQKEKENEASIYRISLDGKSEAARGKALTEAALRKLIHRRCHVERSETSLVYFRETKEAKVHPRFFASLRMTIVCRLSL